MGSQDPSSCRSLHEKRVALAFFLESPISTILWIRWSSNAFILMSKSLFYGNPNLMFTNLNFSPSFSVGIYGGITHRRFDIYIHLWTVIAQWSLLALRHLSTFSSKQIHEILMYIVCFQHSAKPNVCNSTPSTPTAPLSFYPQSHTQTHFHPFHHKSKIYISPSSHPCPHLISSLKPKTSTDGQIIFWPSI